MRDKKKFRNADIFQWMYYIEDLSENEEQIRAFLERHPEYEIQPMGAELPEKLAAHENACGLQMFAHRDGTDGFYVCRMRRVKV